MTGIINRAAVGSVTEVESDSFRAFLTDLENYDKRPVQYCRRWEYPWIFHHGLASYDADKDDCDHLLDIGSGASPMPRWLSAMYGYRVTMVETNPDFRGDCRIVRDERLPFMDNHFDWVTSFSVIEHQPNKQLAIDEIVRVLRPGGCLGITFDLVEPEMGMAYPRNETPMTLKTFEEQIWFHPAFGNTRSPQWNLSDIPDFLAWHHSTHPTHSYVAGGAILQKR
jgi:SAM-dependent methyltransferase